MKLDKLHGKIIYKDSWGLKNLQEGEEARTHASTQWERVGKA
jgi:hypothetical protein